MSPETIQTEILRALREVQELSGRKWSQLGPDLKPIGALDGFDSLASVEATVMIEEKLGCSLDMDSVFLSEDGKRALTVKEISERLAKLLVAKGGKR
jgi:acyl carrier protein